MLALEQILEIETITMELNNLNQVLTVNLEKYADMHQKGYECSYISDLMQEKINSIRKIF